MGECLKKNRDVALIWTQYTLMLYMIVAANWKKTLLFLYYGRLDRTLLRRIYEKGGSFWGGYWLHSLLCIQDGNIFRKIFNRIIDNFFCPLINIILCAWIRIVGKENIHVYGYEHVFGAVSFLDAGCKFSVIEDGMASYRSREKTVEFWQKYHSKFAKPEKFLSGGWSDAVQEVILTGRCETPKGLEAKTYIVNLKKMWNGLDGNRKKEINYIFDFNIKKWKEIITHGRNILFLSQKLAPIYMGEDDEKSLLTELMSQYDNTKIIIKVHPADNTLYEDIFPQCIVIRNSFPVELIWLEDLPIQKIVGFFSTALYGTWPAEMIELRSDLLKRYVRQEMQNIL